MRKLLSLALALVMVASLSAAALADTYGLGIDSYFYAAHSREATADADGVGEVDVTVCALVLDEEGRIVSISFDVVQAKVAFTGEGKFSVDLEAAIRSKKELGDDYNMRRVSALGMEVNEQIEFLEAWCIGKTVEEVVTRAVTSGDNADVDLIAGCTISVDDFIRALILAAENAK